MILKKSRCIGDRDTITLALFCVSAGLICVPTVYDGGNLSEYFKKSNKNDKKFYVPIKIVTYYNVHALFIIKTNMDLIKEVKSFIKKSKNPLIIILGPTGSGKTALSLELAKKLKGEIISADSRQLYKGMEISTDTISKEDQGKIPHHLLGVIKPNESISVAEYKTKATKLIDKLHKNKKIPILVGGTGLYISAIAEGYSIPKIPPNPALRKRLMTEAKKKGNEAIYKRLQKLDPQAARKIHPNNLRYVIRAIEINAAGKKKQDKKDGGKYDIYMVGIDWPRTDLYKRIEKRVDAQIKRGLLKEVKELLDQKYQLDLPSMTSLGVKEIIPHIKNNMPLEKCIEILKRNTRHYAKRQLTWFRKDRKINWLKPKEFKALLK